LIDYEAFCGVTQDIAEFASQLSLTPREVKQMMDAGNEITFIDVREPHEYEIVHLDDSTLMPMNQVIERVSEIPQTGNVVVLCKVGARSAEVLRWLHSVGLTNTKHLAGGIDAWAAQVDPSLPRY
jgi:rhodanese-related sulfurtransferase